MPKEMVVLGPPGTGKTTSMVMTTKEWLQGGLGAGQVGYLAFTKAAAREAESRILDEDFKKDYGDKLPYCRTLHSLAYSGLKKERPGINLINTAHMKGFAKWTGFEGEFALNEWEDLSDAYKKLIERSHTKKSEWDDCLNAYTLSRISAKNEREILAAKYQMSNFAIGVMERIDPSRYAMFVGKYESYKDTNGLVDFTDMLEYALTKMEPLKDVRKVVIDEAQDISPILFSIVERLFAPAEEIWWAGDDDQSIFRFSAADAAMFIAKARKSRKIYLQQTHRFGTEIVDFSRMIIDRVSDRVKKDVLGAPGRSHQIVNSGEFQPMFAPDMLLLHRHVAGCQGLGETYMHEGLPFRNERGKDPLGSYARIQAYKALRDLADGKAVSMGGVSRLIEDHMPSMVFDERKGQKVRLVAHGSKKKLQGSSGGNDVNIMDLQKQGYITSEGSEAIRLKFFNIFKHSEDFEYYDKVVEKGYDLEGKCPVITTIHGSKGRQAKNVVLFSEMGMRCWDDADTEHRLAYVGATRTQKYLEICHESTLPWNRVTRYNYPKAAQKTHMTPIDTTEA